MFVMRFLLLITSLWSSTILAGPILHIENNKLVGVDEVVVGDYFYDVSFVQGSCIDVFNNCSSFPFELLDVRTNPYGNLFDALHALNEAIHDADIIDTARAQWYVPELKIPAKKWYGMADEEAWYISYARYFDAGEYQEYSVEFNFIENEELWTVWSNPRHVPEPSNVILFTTMLLGVYFCRRNKYRQS